MEDLKPTLNKANLIPNINKGGCGIVALGIYNHIKANYPKLRPSIVYMLDDYDLRYGNYSDPDRPDSSFHIVVRVSGKYIDSDGIRTKQQILKEYHETEGFIKVTPEYLEKAIFNAEWNDAFDRKKHKKRLINLFPTISHVLQ